MADEIEKKYLIQENGCDFFLPGLLEVYLQKGSSKLVDTIRSETEEKGVDVLQGYLPKEDGENLAAVLKLQTKDKIKEYRLRRKGDKYFFTMKSDGGLVRGEIEKIIDSDTFNKYWDKTLGKRVSKKRLEKQFRGLIIEFDVYKDRSLVVAEVEFKECENIRRFPLLGIDITEDKKYKNANLAK